MKYDMLKRLTIRRVLNVVKIVSSYLISKYTHNPVVWGKPIAYMIEPTNRCNFKCPECPSGLGELTRPLGMLEMDRYRKIIDEVSKDGIIIQLYFQGEPYINKNIHKMISYAHEKNMFVSLSTNGSYISEKNVANVLKNAPDLIIYSMDGIDNESYKKYRVGGTFDSADKSLRLLVNKKKELRLSSPYIDLQFIVMKHNEHQIDEVLKYGAQIGVNSTSLKTMQVNSVEGAKQFLPDNPKYRRYLFDGNTLRMKGKIGNYCFAIWKKSVITWDGDVVPCCFDKDAHHRVGNIDKIGSFEAIWSGRKYNNFRKAVLKNRRKIPMCNNCTEGLKINILETEL